MNTFVGIWIIVVVSFSQLYLVEAIPKINITIFYESLCPQSKRFIKQQLYPTYSVLEEYINVEFVPFGNAYYTTNPWSFSCQHGRCECYGNTVQACALARYRETKKQVKFVNCVMSENFPPTSGEKCAKKLEFSYSGIDKCASGEEGRRLVVQMGERTRSFREELIFVPTILFNNEFSERNQKEALRNLKSTVCQILISDMGQENTICTN